MAGPAITGFVIPASVAARAWYDAQFVLSGGAAPYANDVDFDIIDVTATVTSPTGVVTHQPCWPGNSTTALTPTSGHGETYSALSPRLWHFSYKFNAPGVWTWTVTATDSAGVTTSAIKSTTVTAAGSGTLAVGGGQLSPWRIKNKWYFAFDDGTFLPMTGQNIAVQDREYSLDGTVGFAKFLGYVGANGGNVARFMLSAYHRNGPEYLNTAAQYQGWDNYGLGLGRYAQQNCFRIDEFLRIATLNGVSVQFCYNTHGEFSTSSDPRWTDSPYSDAHGGPVPKADPALMLTNATAIKYQKMKARHMIARWAPYPAFGAIEHWNEGGAVGNGFFVGNNTVANHAAWVALMGAYIRSIDPWNHAQTWSNWWEPPGANANAIFALGTIDFGGTHNYQHSMTALNDRRSSWPDMVRTAQGIIGKPMIMAETGLYRGGGAPEPNFDPSTSGLTRIQKDHLLAGTHVRETALSSIATGWSGGWEWWHGYLAENAAQHRVSGTLPYGAAGGSYDVAFNGNMSGFAAFVTANPGKIIGLGTTGPLTSTATITLTDQTVNIIQFSPINSTVDASPGAMDLRRCHGTWTNLSLLGPIKAATFTGVANLKEQHHGVRFRGGDLAFVNPIISGFWGDCINYQAFAVVDGGDGVPPKMTLTSPTFTVAGRCNLAGSQFANGSSCTGLTFDQSGAWAIDIEPNVAADFVGSVTFDGGTIGTHSLGNNPTWESGTMEAISLVGPIPTTLKGPITVKNISGADLDMRFRDVSTLTIQNCTSTTSAIASRLRVTTTVQSGNSNITVV